MRIRVDSGVEEGDAVGTYYDPMIAKVVVWGPDRRTALSGLGAALAQTQVSLSSSGREQPRMGCCMHGGTEAGTQRLSSALAPLPRWLACLSTSSS